MGGLISNPASTISVEDQLEEVDKKVKYLQEWIDRQKRKKERIVKITTLIGVMLIVVLLACYAIYIPKDWGLKILYFFLIFLCAALIVACVKTVTCCYDRNIGRKQEKMDVFMSKKEDHLRNIKATQTYDKAQRILTRYGEGAGTSQQKTTINMNSLRR